MKTSDEKPTYDELNEQNDWLYKAYTSAISVMIKASSNHGMLEARNWIDDHVRKHYPRGDELPEEPKKPEPRRANLGHDISEII